jgi:fructokinase
LLITLITIHTMPITHDRPKVLCFGEAMLHRASPADTSAQGPPNDHPGGAPVNVACGISQLGTPAAFLGRLGEDATGREFRQLFADRGVVTMALQWDADHPTRVARSRTDDHGRTQPTTFEGDPEDGFADEAVVPATLAEQVMPLLGDARWLLVDTAVLTAPTTRVALDLLLHRATAKGVAIALDLQWRPGFWGLEPGTPPTHEVLRRCRPLLEVASLIRCNREEAQWFFGTTDAAEIHASLPKRPAVVITDGSGPLQWCLGGRSGSAVPIEAEQALDRSGSSDAFMAGLLDGLCRNPDLLGGVATGGKAVADAEEVQELLRFAMACGTMVSRGHGAIEPQPTRLEVLTFLKS